MPIVASSTEFRVSATIGDPHLSLHNQPTQRDIVAGGVPIVAGGVPIVAGQDLPAHLSLSTDEAARAAVAAGTARIGWRVLVGGEVLAESDTAGQALEEISVVETPDGTVARLRVPVAPGSVWSLGAISLPDPPIDPAAAVTLEVTHRAPGGTLHRVALLTDGRVSSSSWIVGSPDGRWVELEAVDHSVSWGEEPVDLVVPAGSQQWRGVLIGQLLTGAGVSSVVPGISRLSARVQIAAIGRRDAIETLLSGTGRSLRVSRAGIVETPETSWVASPSLAGSLGLTSGAVEVRHGGIYRARPAVTVTADLAVDDGSGDGDRCPATTEEQIESVAGELPVAPAAYRQTAGTAPNDGGGNPVYTGTEGDLTATGLSASVPDESSRVTISTSIRCGQVTAEIRDEWAMHWPLTWRYLLDDHLTAAVADGGVVVREFSSCWVEDSGAVKLDGNVGRAAPRPAFRRVARTVTLRSWDARGHLETETTTVWGWSVVRAHLKQRDRSANVPWEEQALPVGPAPRDLGNGEIVAIPPANVAIPLGSEGWQIVERTERRLTSDALRYLRSERVAVERLYAREGSEYLYGDDTTRRDPQETLRLESIRQVSYLGSGEGGHRVLTRVFDSDGQLVSSVLTPTEPSFIPEVPVLEAAGDVADPEVPGDTRQVSRTVGSGLAETVALPLASSEAEIEEEALRVWQERHAADVVLSVPLSTYPQVGSWWTGTRIGQTIQVRTLEHRIGPDGFLTAITGKLFVAAPALR